MNRLKWQRIVGCNQEQNKKAKKKELKQSSSNSAHTQHDRIQWWNERNGDYIICKILHILPNAVSIHFEAWILIKFSLQILKWITQFTTILRVKMNCSRYTLDTARERRREREWIKWMNSIEVNGREWETARSVMQTHTTELTKVFCRIKTTTLIKN